MPSFICCVIYVILAVQLGLYSLLRACNVDHPTSEVINEASVRNEGEEKYLQQKEIPSASQVESVQTNRKESQATNSIEKADEEYEKYHRFIQRVKKHPTLGHLGNEKKLFSLLTAYHTTPPSQERCLSIQGFHSSCP